MPRRRKRSSWGCVTRLSADRWRLRWVQGGKRRTEVVHGTRRQADDRLAQLRVEVGSDAESRVTLGQAYERWWLPQARRDVEAGRITAQTQANRETLWRRHVSPRWADAPVRSIRPLDVQGWLSGMSAPAAKKSRSLMRAVINLCVMFEVVAKNPMDASYQMPDSPGRTVDDGSWDVDGLRDVWAAVRGSFVEAPVLLMAFGSARVGESLGVMADEVRAVGTPHGAVAVAPVRRQVLNSGGGVSEGLKTDWSPRPLAIPGPMGARVLALARAASPGWLCGDGVGGPSTQDALRKEFYRLVAAAGVERHPLKSLRKSWETTARWTLRMPPQVTEKMMGHLAPDVTSRHYDRPSEEDFARHVAEAYAAHPFADAWGLGES